MEFTGLRMPKDFLPCLDGWNGLRVYKGFRAQLTAAARVSLSGGFSLKEGKFSSLMRALAKSLL